jgi:hypothetical protein
MLLMQGTSIRPPSGVEISHTLEGAEGYPLGAAEFDGSGIYRMTLIKRSLELE